MSCVEVIQKNLSWTRKNQKAINLPLLHILHKGYKHFESVSVYHCVNLSVLRVLMVIICHYERLSSYISVCASFFLLFICYLCPLDAFHFLCWLFYVSHCLSVIKNVFLYIIMCVYMFICHYLYHYAHHF